VLLSNALLKSGIAIGVPPLLTDVNIFAVSVTFGYPINDTAMSFEELRKVPVAVMLPTFRAPVVDNEPAVRAPATDKFRRTTAS
jgi:hypothetical protein